ncbi:MAG: class I SAM-dependent methyltransferase [Clostridium cadaveris]|uniref:tRNA (mnm(5)s(2)U34)-methyltransferase n=1 Tax=Clostridium cadaveris TaxID=1529 RepID=UPI002A8D4DDB|nr:class I SAM-dependent methyltransferase [Clostridium cadaveris]
MFRYVGDVSNLSHNIIKNYGIKFNVALDGTLGNGNDTKFLENLFKKTYSFDIQKECIDKYEKENPCNKVILINDSHEKVKEYIASEKIDAAMFNLGFLPGGNKSITTEGSSSLKAIKDSLELLIEGGIMTIACYIGHEKGKEEYEIIKDYLCSIDKFKFGVMEHSFLNRSQVAPRLIVVEKKIC